jgi:tight adherence protein B
VTGLALVEGIAVVVGLLLAASGLRRAPVRLDPPRRPWRHLEIPSPERLAAVGASALAVLLFTRWPVAALAASIAVAFGTSPSLRRRVDDAEKAEALTVWAEMLRDATGTPRGIEGVLVATAPSAPPPIRAQVQRLARRLPYDPLDVALSDLATDLDDPVGDLVVTALRLSARSGGRQIRAVLDDLASVAREKARMHRRIDVARARPRSDMRAVIVVMGAFVVLFVLLARDYLAPYGTGVGQTVLGLVAACWAAGVWAMARLARPRSLERFLARSAGEEVLR